MTINNTQITEFSLDQLGDNFAAGLIGVSLIGIAKLGKAQAEVSETELELTRSCSDSIESMEVANSDENLDLVLDKKRIEGSAENVEQFGTVEENSVELINSQKTSEKSSVPATSPESSSCCDELIEKLTI